MVLSRLSASVFVIVLVLSSGACDKTKDSPGQKKILARRQKELLIGLIPELNVFHQRERYLGQRNYLSDRFGSTVNFTSLSRYENIIDRFVVEKIDGAFFRSFTYALAHSRHGVEAIARPVNLDGALPIIATSSLERTEVSIRRPT